MELRTLLLTSWGSPHAILNWKDAICLMYENKVHVMDSYEETVSSPSTTFFVPAVLMLKRKVSPVKKGVKFSRINVLTRDRFTCQYCRTTLPMTKLNYDHVIPRKQGGRTVWENIVACCYPCNERKGARTPEQAKMTLMRPPARPHSLPLHAVFFEGSIPDCWKPYLDLNKIDMAGQGQGVYVVGDSQNPA